MGRKFGIQIVAFDKNSNVESRKIALFNGKDTIVSREDIVKKYGYTIDEYESDDIPETIGECIEFMGFEGYRLYFIYADGEICPVPQEEQLTYTEESTTAVERTIIAVIKGYEDLDLKQRREFCAKNVKYYTDKNGVAGATLPLYCGVK